jgi:hypothetical protein
VKRLVVVTTVGVVLATAGAASAYLTAPGSGTATAATGQPTAVTLSPGSPDDALRPGAAADVVLTATNPGTTSVVLTSLVLDTSRGTGGFAVDEAHDGCPAATFSLAAASYDGGGSGWTVPAASGSTPGTLAVALPDALTMALDAPNGCQGASVTVYVRAGS